MTALTADDSRLITLSSSHKESVMRTMRYPVIFSIVVLLLLLNVRQAG